MTDVGHSKYGPVRVGDLVEIDADNVHMGLGFVIEEDTDGASFAYRVLTPDGRCLFYHPFELTLVSRASKATRGKM